VTASYREAIRQTVEHFTGKPVQPGEIQDYKNAGGWNNDWALSHRMCQDRGVELGYAAVVDHFQRIFLGTHFDGLIQREVWAPRTGLLQAWATRFQLAVFTGREHAEAMHTLRRFAPEVPFHPVLGDEDVTHKKPHPEGLQRIAALYPGSRLTYIGDTVDDARSAKAAGVRFLGVADPKNPRVEELRALLWAEGAVAVAPDLNELDAVIDTDAGDNA
jgi:HAD superfamily phosphatase